MIDTGSKSVPGPGEAGGGEGGGRGVTAQLSTEFPGGTAREFCRWRAAVVVR